MLIGRLVALRAVELRDLDLLTRLANHRTVRNSVVGWDWPVSHLGQDEWLRGSRNNPDTRRLVVTTADSDEAIGLTGLWDVDWRNRSAVTGVKLMPGMAPKGAGSDSIMLVMAWSFYEVGLRRLHSTILGTNKASLGAYVGKCGWQIEGRARQAVFRNGTWNDLLHVAILRSEFDALELAPDYVARVLPSSDPGGPAAPVRSEAPAELLAAAGVGGARADS